MNGGPKVDSQQKHTDYRSKISPRTRYISHTSSADRQTYRTEMYVGHALTKILLAAGGERRILYCRAMYELHWHW